MSAPPRIAEVTPL